MVDYQQRIKELEDELKKTPYNKRTQHHIGLVKAKIAKLKDQDIARSSSKGKSEGYSVRKTGDGTVILIGFPSVGKSTLLNALTNAKSEVGSYDFTTLDVIPGLLEYKHAKIQVLDVPGIVHGAASGRGRGKEVLAVMRNADLVMVLVDANHPEHHNAVLKEIYDSGLRLNQQSPDVRIKKKARGGISIGTTVRLKKIDKKTIEAILREMRISNADVIIRTDIDADQLIDVIEGNKRYVPGITLITKADTVSKEEIHELKKEIMPDILISAQKSVGIEELKERIFDSLGFIRIYCKEVNKKADLDVPMILKKPVTIATMCTKLHKDFLDRFRFAKVWGNSAKFPGQIFHKTDHTLKDKDIVELHIR
ncbi:GTP-binding protein [Candidatus Woesearchaeota archaeon]|nr:GTP-binding protein [Candidatus Woesearchaeota archaeon]